MTVFTADGSVVNGNTDIHSKGDYTNEDCYTSLFQTILSWGVFVDVLNKGYEENSLQLWFNRSVKLSFIIF